MTIKKFSIEYDAINSKNTFTNGDIINGRIIVEVSGETKIQSLIFRGQGRAKVCWSEHYGQDQTHVYWATEKYYDIKQDILRESRHDGTEVIGKGRHIPILLLCGSFESHGKIVHKVKAELKQSMKITKKTKAHFTFVSKTHMGIPGLLGCFSLVVTVEINNNSSRTVKPKFILYQKHSFFAQGHRTVYTHDILKDKAEAVEASSGRKTVTKVITIPGDLPPSILNSHIINLEYRLKLEHTLQYPFLKMGTTIPVCQSRGTAPDLHATLQRRVNQDNPTTSRAFRNSGQSSSTPGALPPRSCLTASVTSPPEIGGSSPSSPDSASATEDVPVGLRRSSKYSFDRRTIFSALHPHYTQCRYSITFPS
uniref:Arrestin domain-containing protein 3 n=1 Tax=Maylandia zebra TaxID=106582 RepID=A0A3P9CC49_9CICH